MSAHPSYTMAGLCSAGGVFAYASRKSIPSFVGGVAVGAAYALSGTRIQEGAPYGYEAATASSAALLAASLPRALKVRAPVPIFLSLAAIAAGGYYGKAVVDYS